MNEFSLTPNQRPRPANQTDPISPGPGHVSFGIGNALKDKEPKKYLVLHRRTVSIREELTRCTFLEKNKRKGFISKIENKMRILRGASALYCI